MKRIDSFFVLFVFFQKLEIRILNKIKVEPVIILNQELYINNSVLVVDEILFQFFVV
jgi:hypothetical protein